MPHKSIHNTPAYLRALSKGTLRKKAQEAVKLLTCCTLCPRQCKVNRLENNTGFCRTGRQAKVHRFMLHHGEEPPISGEKGSGTIFFSGCTMACSFCQNYTFSQEESGREVSSAELADIMRNLQSQGAHNINLVTPTHVMPQVLEALLLAAENGLSIPLIYNTSGYERALMIEFLDGIVDVYLPDLRYTDEANALKYSFAPGYPHYNQEALTAMHRQVGIATFNEQGIIDHGLIIRHLVLPRDIAGTELAMRFIAHDLTPETYVSLMSQYLPCHKAHDFKELSRRISAEEYKAAQETMERHGIHNGWTQEGHGLDSMAGFNL